MNNEIKNTEINFIYILHLGITFNSYCNYVMATYYDFLPRVWVLVLKKKVFLVFLSELNYNYKSNQSQNKIYSNM